MRLPRGMKLENERVEDGQLVYDVKIKRWRMALMALSILRRSRITARRAA